MIFIFLYQMQLPMVWSNDILQLSLSMNASGASVAVFSEGAKDMFPDPTTAIDEDDVGEEVDDDGEPVKKNRWDICIWNCWKYEELS